MMKRWIAVLLDRPLQVVLITCFALVAALTIGLGTIVISCLIDDYLAEAEAERVARDMNLATVFYQLKQDEIAAIGHRLILDPWVVDNLPAAIQGEAGALDVIDQQIITKINVLALGGTHLIAATDAEGNIITGRVLSFDGEVSPLLEPCDWSTLPIMKSALESGQELTATEVIPVELLAPVGLDQQAFIALIDTPRAASTFYDLREGTASLALVSVSPVHDSDGTMIGAILAAYLFNNDFTLVDRIKAEAGIDTVTIFLGDLRVSTNVMTAEGERAIGTRVSDEVYNVVLLQGSDYVGRAFVVNDWFITRYEPLRDHEGEIVGMLYVGALESVFRSLLQAFNNGITIIALVCIIVAGVIAVPIARLITRPVADLVAANRSLAQGDISVRVVPSGGRDLEMLGHSFNKMVETLVHTRAELLHQERLASTGQLAAKVAHEINNPLGMILLYADILYKEANPEDSRRTDLKLIIDETLRCKNIVSDLLNYVRQQDILAEETDIHALIDQVIELGTSHPDIEHIRVVCHFDPNLPHIQADPAQLRQVFVNLFNNAAEAMPDGGVITFTTRIKNAREIEILVSDTGSGIPEENLNKLFTPFFTTKALGKGTGLGLSIVYGIIKVHRGQISVRSGVDQGTTFYITLPVQLSAGKPTGASRSSSAIL